MTYETDQGVTATLAEFAARQPVPPECHATTVARALADTVGVALAATDSPTDRILGSWARRQELGTGATEWTSGAAAAPATAALLNGTAAHVLDYDDISPSMPMHPSAVLLPTLLALGEARGATAADLVAAYDVGATAFRALAELLPQEIHYATGWHTTATVGRLAAVAAGANLTGAAASTTAHALGVVSSLASGARSNFGTMTKPLHAGLAARDAVMALELADCGFTANPGELEAPGGFLDRLGEPARAPVGDLADTLAERLDYWLASWPRDWGLKRYPACYGTHRAIDAALAARQQAPAAEPSAVRIAVHPGGLAPLIAARPSTGTQAKFSLEYVVAVALLQGSVGFGDFTDAALAEPRRRSLLERITVTETDLPPTGSSDFTDGFAVVRVSYADGTDAEHRVDVARGDGRNPMTDGELRAKFADCCAVGGVPPSTATGLYDACGSLAGPAPIRELTGTLAAAAATRTGPPRGEPAGRSPHPGETGTGREQTIG